MYVCLVGKPDGQKTLGIPMRSWKDNIKTGLKEVGSGTN
jgi:hypothetical protein